MSREGVEPERPQRMAEVNNNGSAAGYTTGEVAGLIGLTHDQVRQYVKRGIVEPKRGGRREYRFSFQDVVLLRAAKGLLDHKVPARKAISALTKLKGRLPEATPLASLRIFADGKDVVVRAEEELWDAESGQGHLDFGAPAAAEASCEVARITDRELGDFGDSKELGSHEWYNLGLDYEDVDVLRAKEAYARAIALNPDNADAHVNLGRLFQLEGDLKRAKRHYGLALDAAPEHELANYNTGTVFDELDELSTAAQYYHRAPGVPDAHYNLARIFELRGDDISSLRHLRTYRLLLEEKT